MDTNEFSPMKPNGDDLFDRVVSILEQARTNVVWSVNNNMVIAYWLIGREIVQEIQGGDNRAEYGKQIIKDLSDKLNSKYGKGFSTSNLWYFRQFYIVYSNREPKIRHKLCGELDFWEKLHKPCGVLDDLSLSVEKSELIQFPVLPTPTEGGWCSATIYACLNRAIRKSAIRPLPWLCVASPCANQLEPECE